MLKESVGKGGHRGKESFWEHYKTILGHSFFYNYPCLYYVIPLFTFWLVCNPNAPSVSLAKILSRIWQDYGLNQTVIVHESWDESWQIMPGFGTRNMHDRPHVSCSIHAWLWDDHDMILTSILHDLGMFLTCLTILKTAVFK